MGDAVEGEDRETVDLVVVAGMIAERAFQGGIIGMDVSLQHDLRPCRYLEIIADAGGNLGATAAQQPGKAIFRQAVWYRGDSAEDGGRVRAESY